MITKGTKNQITLNADFFKLSFEDNNNTFVIQLDENDDASLIKKDKEKIINKINSLKNELNQVNNLMQYIDEKLLLYENNNNLKNDSKKKLNININKNPEVTLEGQYDSKKYSNNNIFKINPSKK